MYYNTILYTRHCAVQKRYFLVDYLYYNPMPRNPIEAVEIVEPPIRELTKSQSSFKRGCFTGCLFIIVCIGLGLGTIKILIGAGPSTIKTLPANFPKDIPVYDKDAIEQITYIPGKYKYRSTEIAALFPKVLLSPLLVRVQDAGQSTATATSSEAQSTWQDIWQILATPVSNLNDTVEIEWKNLDAEPSFIYTYYKKELSKKKYLVSDEVRERAEQHFSFNREDGVSGFLVVKGDEEAKPGTDYAALTVTLPKENRFVPVAPAQPPIR